jgi:hypothetical protein
MTPLSNQFTTTLIDSSVTQRRTCDRLLGPLVNIWVRVKRSRWVRPGFAMSHFWVRSGSTLGSLSVSLRSVGTVRVRVQMCYIWDQFHCTITSLFCIRFA